MQDQEPRCEQELFSYASTHRFPSGLPSMPIERPRSRSQIICAYSTGVEGHPSMPLGCKLVTAFDKRGREAGYVLSPASEYGPDAGLLIDACPVDDLRIGPEVKGRDAVTGDSEANDGDHLPVCAHHHARGAMDDGRMGQMRKSRASAHDPAGNRAGPGQHRRYATAFRVAIDPEDDVRIEHGDQRLEVATARRGQEGIDHPPLLLQVWLGHPSGAHPPSGAAGELASRR